MQIIEIVRRLLNINKHAFAYANCETATNDVNDQNGKNNVMAFWQSSFDSKAKRENLDVKHVQHEQKVDENAYPSDTIRRARKLAKIITKIAKESPKSLTHYLSKEDVENLELLSKELTVALVEMRVAKQSEEKNPRTLN